MHHRDTEDTEMMHVETTRFGTVEIPSEHVIEFGDGLLGFPEMRRYVMLQPGEDVAFWWMQSLDDPALAWVVTDPVMFESEYHVEITAEIASGIGLASIDDAQVMVIVNRIAMCLTGNMQGPLVINTKTRRGVQVVNQNREWTTRHPLVAIPAGSEFMN